MLSHRKDPRLAYIPVNCCFLSALLSARNAINVDFGHRLWLTRLFDVTDHHDRIYSILGLVGGKTPADFTVDYPEPSSTLSARVNRLIIDQGSLAVASSLLAAYGTSGLPSWRFDLVQLCRRDGTLRWVKVCGKMHCTFRACGDTQPSGQWLCGADDILVLRGSTLGQVVAASDQLIATGPSYTSQLNYRTLLWNRKLLKMIRAHLRTADLVGVQETLIAAAVADGRSAGWTTVQRRASLQAASMMVNARGGRWTMANAFKIYVTIVPKQPPRFFEDLTPYAGLLRRLCVKQVVCVMEHGQIGTVPKGAIAGDEIAIFLGCPEPFLIRRREGTYQILGPVYIHGWMDGEALDSKLWYEEDFYIS